MLPITIATVETKVATKAKVADKPTIESSGDCQLRSAVEWSIKPARSTAELGLAKHWTPGDSGSCGDADVDVSATFVSIAASTESAPASEPEVLAVRLPTMATDSVVLAAEPAGSTLESVVLASKPEVLVVWLATTVTELAVPAAELAGSTPVPWSLLPP